MDRLLNEAKDVVQGKIETMETALEKVELNIPYWQKMATQMQDEANKKKRLSTVESMQETRQKLKESIAYLKITENFELAKSLWAKKRYDQIATTEGDVVCVESPTTPVKLQLGLRYATATGEVLDKPGLIRVVARGFPVPTTDEGKSYAAAPLSDATQARPTFTPSDQPIFHDQFHVVDPIAFDGPNPDQLPEEVVEEAERYVKNLTGYADMDQDAREAQVTKRIKWLLGYFPLVASGHKEQTGATVNPDAYLTPNIGVRTFAYPPYNENVARWTGRSGDGYVEPREWMQSDDGGVSTWANTAADGDGQWFAKEEEDDEQEEQGGGGGRGWRRPNGPDRKGAAAAGNRRRCAQQGPRGGSRSDAADQPAVHHA